MALAESVENAGFHWTQKGGIDEDHEYYFLGEGGIITMLSFLIHQWKIGGPLPDEVTFRRLK